MPVIMLMFILSTLIAVVVAVRFMANNPDLMAQLKSGTGSTGWLDRGLFNAAGQSVKFHYTPRSKNTPAKLRASLTGNFFAHALFRLENEADRLAKNIGFSREIELRDPSFDSMVYVECEDQSFVEQFLNSSEARDHLRNILRTFNSFEINGRTCAMVKTPCDTAWRAQEAEMTAAAMSMAALTAGMPAPEPGQVSATPLSDANRSLTAFMIGAGIFFLIAGIASVVWGFVSFSPVVPSHVFMVSLRGSVLCAGLFVLYIISAIKGTSTAVRVFSSAVIAGVIGLGALGWGGMMVINGTQDTSMKEPHQVRIIGKHTSRSKNSTTYYIRTSSWTPVIATYSFSVPYGEYSRLEVNDPCEITTGSGFFKFEWIYSHACAKAGAVVERAEE